LPAGIRLAGRRLGAERRLQLRLGSIQEALARGEVGRRMAGLALHPTAEALQISPLGEVQGQEQDKGDRCAERNVDRQMPGDVVHVCDGQLHR
jgi:hypothetical protein